MFAICAYGYYEDYGICCIEIKPQQKELFKKYCLDSQKVNSHDLESLKLEGYSDLDYRQFVNDINKFNIGISIDCMTIEEHQNKCKKILEYILIYDNHYLSDKINELSKLLEYNFK